jgi:hypothetical protein
MPFSDATSQLEPLLFQMKQYKNLTKSTIEVLPSSGQQSYKPNQKCIFTLPYASTISLEDIALHFTFTPENIPKTATDDAECQRVLPPKDVASLISEIDIKINGQTIQHLTNYNDIVNLLNLFEDAKTAKKVLQGCDVTNTRVETSVGTVVKIENNTKYLTTVGLNNKPKSYVINHWYGLLGHRGDEVSSNFLDTNMLGEVTIAFTFASASVLIGQAGAEADVRTATGKGGSVTTAEITAAIKASTASYSLSDVKMSMVRYNLPVEFSEATRSNLNSGVKYQIAFNHYENHSTNALASSGSIRWNENSRDIKGLLAYFTSNERDSTNVPTLYSAQVESSVYFKYDNVIHDKSQFQVGSVKMPQNSLNTTDAFLELTRGIQGARGNNVEFFHKIKCVEDWAESYFMAYLSLEMSEGMTHLANGGKKLLSGLSSEQLPISCSYHYTNRSAPSAITDAWKKNVNVMSLTTRMLVVESGQNCYVEI